MQHVYALIKVAIALGATVQIGASSRSRDAARGTTSAHSEAGAALALGLFLAMGPAHAADSAHPVRAERIVASPVEPLSAEPRFRRSQVTIPRVINADTINQVRAELAGYEDKLAAAAPGSSDQIELAATLALNYARIGDERKAVPHARIAATGADALWVSDPQTAGFAYAAIAQMHGYLGHLYDGQRVAEDGQMRWLASRPRTPAQNRADYADGSRYLLLVRVAAQNELLRQCRAEERPGARETAWLKAREGAAPEFQPTTSRKVIVQYDLRWPPELLALRQCAFVMVRFTIRPDGTTAYPQTLILSGPRAYESHVQNAILAMRYEPSSTDEDELNYLVVKFLFI